MDRIELARSAALTAEEHQATGIILLDIRELTPFADFFVICNGTSERQIRAIGDAVEEALRPHVDKPPRREGTAGSGWYLLDYGDVIVHIFSPEQRDFYRLERLWERGKTLLTLQ
ncbi:MAG TPA: ribosome silencing factor [Dehalococcoidia bacterium]|nr:ribosome silencing factor [Dehalococcoidia bacterium]